MSGGDMLTGGVVRRKPLSLMSKGEKIGKLRNRFHQCQRERMLNMVVIDVKGVQ